MCVNFIVTHWLEAINKQEYENAIAKFTTNSGLLHTDTGERHSQSGDGSGHNFLGIVWCDKCVGDTTPELGNGYARPKYPKNASIIPYDLPTVMPYQ